MEAWAEAWLARLCQMVGDASVGVLILGTPGRGPFSPVASQGESPSAVDALTAVADLAIAERRAAIRGPKPEAGSVESPVDRIALPLLLDDELIGAVAVELPSRSEPQQRAALQIMQWGSSWLEILIRHRPALTPDRLSTLLDLVATSLESERFQAAATALVTELATRLSCESVGLGSVHRDHVRLRALSHSARFGKSTDFVTGFEAAMDEALDQQDTLLFPAPGHAPPRPLRAHEALASQHGAVAICTIPLTDGGRVVGALTLERGRGGAFDAQEVELCERIASTVGPILDLKRREDRPFAEKAWDAFRAEIRTRLGPRGVAFKVGAILLSAVIVFLTLAQGVHSVKADAILEGYDQRVMVAAFDGYVAAAHARAGDIVQSGQVLATLDDRDLRLSRMKWSSSREQLLKEYREALADHDAARVRILRAQIGEAEAQLDLVDEQLLRTRIVAPVDGLVVSGDLSQAVGSPVRRGDFLFKVAPLDGYRVILEIDEREIAYIQSGQQGNLALSAMPGAPLLLTVEKITPLSTSRDGRTFFRAEAGLGLLPDFLRPGMGGVARIEVDRRRLVWIWTHALTDWLRLLVWSWWR